MVQSGPTGRRAEAREAVDHCQAPPLHASESLTLSVSTTSFPVVFEVHSFSSRKRYTRLYVSEKSAVKTSQERFSSYFLDYGEWYLPIITRMHEGEWLTALIAKRHICNTLEQGIRKGSLEIVDGKDQHHFGTGEEGPAAKIIVNNADLWRRVFIQYELGCQAYLTFILF